PAVTLIARPLDERNPRALPLITALSAPPPGSPPPAFISEAMRDLYKMELGVRIELPIAGRNVAFIVAGIWRDYARQTGAVLIDRTRYIALTGDELANEIWLWLAPGADRGEVTAELRRTLPNANFEIRAPSELRAISLAVFDRTFAVTYVL